MSKNIFDYANKNDISTKPLSYRMRPQSLLDIIGQESVVGKNSVLYKMIENDLISSIIFYGPPGSGKTTIAQVIANTTKSNFVSVNASSSSKKDLEDAINNAKDQMNFYKKRTILFIDEIHRFNKGQQDYLLPFVEDGTVILIGATTENPYYEVNPALISRARIFELKKLSIESIVEIIDKTLNDEINGLKILNIKMDDNSKKILATFSNGDARIALNTLDILSRIADKNDKNETIIDKETILKLLPTASLYYDQNSENHYDTISAFIKSMRGSDMQATSYYLARMLKAGEDINFIARRIMICAAEDVGLADPMAIVIATSCANAIEKVGMPEARIILAEAALYVAKAKKSNSAYMAINNALEEVDNTGSLQIPTYLKNVVVTKDKNAGAYKYPHNYPGHFVDQIYLPFEIKDEIFYKE